jgi:hypothetical protein
LDICRLFDHSITIDHINRLFDTGVHCIILVPDNGWREQPDLFCRPDVQPGESGTVWQSRVGRPAVRPAPAVHPEASSRTRWKQKSGLREGLPRSDIF